MSCNSILKKIDIIDKDDVFSSKNFRKWALKNHPDKGGDSDIFAIVSNCIDEYNSPPKQFYNGPNPFESVKKSSVPFGFRPPSAKSPSAKSPSAKTSYAKTSYAKTKVCPEGKILNPKTNRCVNKAKAKEEKVCPEGKILNPKTNRCVKKDGKIGREIRS